MAPHEVRQANTDQVLPTWLTYSPILLPSGGTSYTILRLPLTYYGPSIPLGTDGTWTYGGLSSPAPSSTATITTATSTPPPATTSPPVTTSSSSTLPTSTSLSSTSSTSTTSSLPTTTSFATPITTRRPTSTSSSPSSTSTSPVGAQNSRLPAVAIALIALGAAAAVLLCCLIAALLWRRRKARRREPPRGDSEFYAGPGPDDEGSMESLHDVPGLLGERRSLLGNDSFVVLGARPPPMAQRSIGGVSYQRLNESQISRHSSRRTGSEEIGVAYTEMPPPRTRRRTITTASQPQSSSPSHPTSSSHRAFGSMRNGSQRSSLFEHPAEQDESPVLPRDSTGGVLRRASDLDQRPIQPPAPAASSPFGLGAGLGAELGMLGLGRRYPDVSQSLLATSSSGGSMPPRLVVPTPSSLGSRSRSGIEYSRPPSQMFAGSNTGSRASRGHSPTPSETPASPPARDTLSWPDSPESEHDESAQLLRAERGNVQSGIGLLGRFSWFTRGNGRSSTPARASRASYPGWMSPTTEEGFLAEGGSEFGAGPSDPPTLESKPPASHPGMVRLVTSRDRETPPTPSSEPNAPRPISSVSGQSVYHDAPSQPATPRSQVSTWLGFLGRASPSAGPAPPVPSRPSPLSQDSSSTPLPGLLSLLARDEAQPPSGSEGGDILDAPAPESLLEITPPTVPPSPATPVNAPVFPPGLMRLPRTWNFGLLNELGDEPPAAEERWAHIRSSPDNWNLRRLSLGQAVRINSPHAVTESQVASVHGGTGSNSRSAHSHSPSMASDPHLPGSGQGQLSDVSSRSQYSQLGTELRQSGTEARSEGSRDSRHGAGAPDTTTVSSNNPYHPETLVTESESGRFGLDFAFSFGGDNDSEYETRATTVSSRNGSGSSSGHEAVDLHAEMRRSIGQELIAGLDGLLRAPPMSAFGQSRWGEQIDADLGRV
ncbi:alphaherpesvirus glycoprotein E domain protein [Ceratobasidium sp. AG-Ba]|nr:alphaherpesvirus glycoprotein E domain protein [Ceratobasidium sp. AG-Ba]